jgi:hypothetical protein
MKSKIKNLVFASLVGLTLSSHGATLFNEDFADDLAGPNMAVSAGFTYLPAVTAATATTTGSFTITSGASNRIYLGTNDTDYSSTDFTFRADVTSPNFGNDWAIIFMGMGSSTPGGQPVYGEPVTGSNIMMALQGSNQTFRGRSNGVDSVLGGSLGLSNTTHGIKMDWNATTQIATFGFDFENDGNYSGASDKSFTINGSANGFTSTNSQLFLGGGNGLIFDNISIVPEPSAALLGALGVLCLVRRRRA